MNLVVAFLVALFMPLVGHGDAGNGSQSPVRASVVAISPSPTSTPTPTPTPTATPTPVSVVDDCIARGKVAHPTDPTLWVYCGGDR